MDTETFKRTFLPYSKKLYRIAYRFFENQADAEDMVQETYIKLWQKRNELEYLDSTESFAITILKNKCLDFIKKIKPEESPMYEISIPITDSLSVNIESKDKLNHVENILEQLPLQQKQIMQMKHWDNLSDEEIEKETGLTRGNIKVIISRARKRIKELYLKLEGNEKK